MNPVFVTTSWDDGHTHDVRLSALLKKYGIRGTFYIAPQDHESALQDRLTDEEIRTLGASFEIGAHTMTHVRLPKVSNRAARAEIEGSKYHLEKILDRSVNAFCYPRGEYRARHIAMVRDAGFTYARTVKRHSFGPEDRPLEARTTVNTYNHYSDLWAIARFAKFNPAKIVEYFEWDNLAKAMFDRVQETGGEYHLWGHSWEIEEHGDWEKLEGVLAYIAHKENVSYVTNSELVARQPKRLLIAIPYFPPYLGGTQLYAYNIANRLQNDLGWEVTIVTSGKRGFRAVEENYEGLHVYRLPYWFKLSNTPINFWWPFMFRRIIKKGRFSIINAHAPVPFMSDVVSLVKGEAPFVLTYHTGTMKKKEMLPNILIWLYENGPLRALLGRADFIICSSNFVRFSFLERYSYKSATITPAVDWAVFKPGLKKTPTQNVLFVAGLTRSEQHKGLPVLITAFDSLRIEYPNLRLVIVGDGDMRGEYEKNVEALGLAEKVTFRGRLDRKELVHEYQEADIFVLPSLAPAESFGMVLVEAMAAGVPVIGSRAGGIPLVIDHEKSGLLVDSGDVQALALAIKRLLDDPELAKRLSEAGQKKTKDQYDWGVQASIYDQLLKNIPGKKPNVAQIVAYYPPHLGGMEVVASEISLELTREGYPVTVLTSRIGGEAQDDSDFPYDIKRMRSLEVAHTPILWSLPFHLLGLPKESIFHVHIAQAGIPEIAWLTAKIKGVPLVLHFHLDIGPSGSLGGILPFYKKYFLGPVLRSAEKVIVFSEDQANLLRAKYFVEASRIAIIPNGVNEAFFNRQKKIEPSERLNILYVGRLSVQKRAERLIEAMGHMKVPAHLTLVGDGEERRKLEALAKRLKLDNVSFEGKKYGDELKGYYRDADVFVISSDIEGMPLVVLEAMAAGLPIVGSDVPGIRELVRGTGVLVAEPYPEKFADALTVLANDRTKLQALSQQSLKKADQYSWKKLIERLEMVYKEIGP